MPCSRLAVLSVPLVLLACLGAPSDGAAPETSSRAARPRAHTVASSPLQSAAGARRPENLDARAADRATRDAARRAPALEWRARTADPIVRAAAAGGRDPVAAALAELGLDPGAASARAPTSRAGPVDEAVVAGVHDLGRGAVIVQLQRRVAGLEVFGEKTAVVMTQDLRPVARSGAVPAPTRTAPSLPPFTRSGAEAIAAALTDLTGEVYAAGDLVPRPAAAGDPTATDLRADLAEVTAIARGVRLAAPARARPVLFPLAGALIPAYRVEVAVRRPREALLGYAYVISAADGAILLRRDQVQREAFSYQVWAAPPDAADAYLPHDGPVGLATTPAPHGVPEHVDPGTVERSLVTLQSYPFSRGDPWLAPGATATQGNNVDAYADVSGADGFDAQDTRAGTTGPSAFGHAYDLGLAPDASADEVQAAIVQLFYDANFFHDWYYDSGFDEASGNAQESNYGRGGQEHDPLHAEAQDSAGIDNADMYTPGDGTSPRLQMYLWAGRGARGVEITAPAAIAGEVEGQVAQFGPAVFDRAGAIVAVTPADACAPLAGALAGAIALVDRGSCTFKTKAANAQAAGALGVVVRNVAGGSQTFSGMADDPAVATAITILVLQVQQADGATLAEGTAARVFRSAALMRDGALDNLVVAHEWGHYISNRLIGDGAGLQGNQAGGLGEGWGDTHALLLAVRAADADVASNAGWSGTYGLTGWVLGGLDWTGEPTDAFYFGVRRVPYSTDMQKDPLTFRHIATGQPLVPPGSTIPISTRWADADNAEVHNTGEVWATMLWECYAALLRDTQGASPRLTFDAARGRWKDYLVAAYKLTPLDPTLLQARDALLAVAYATDARDYQLFWEAFAKRGAGAGAVGPAADSPDNTPVVESYATGLETVVSATFEASAATCTDGDAYLDAGERGTLHVVLRNDGASPLLARTAAASTAAAGLTVGAAPLSIPASAAGASVTVDVPVALAATATTSSADLTLAFDDGARLRVTVPLDRDVAGGQLVPDAGRCAAKASGGGGCASGGGTDLAALVLVAGALGLLRRRRRCTT
jgi:hypothetical protein